MTILAAVSFQPTSLAPSITSVYSTKQTRQPVARVHLRHLVLVINVCPSLRKAATRGPWSHVDAAYSRCVISAVFGDESAAKASPTVRAALECRPYLTTTRPRRLYTVVITRRAIIAADHSITPRRPFTLRRR